MTLANARPGSNHAPRPRVAHQRAERHTDHMSVPIAPGLLISMPDLLDPNFFRSVILMCQHSEDGSFGLKINHPLEITTAQVCSEVEIAWHGEDEQAAFSGGPVEPFRGWLIHLDDSMYDGSEQVGHGIAISSSQDALEAYGRSPEGAFRLVLGYAGWGAGQLDREMDEGAWMRAPLSRALLFETPPEDIWSAALRSIGVDPLRLVGGGSAIN
jgi:putative transcriptional regulator